MTFAGESVDAQSPPSSNGAAGAAIDRLRRDLRAVVILGGRVRKTELSTAVNRAIMDLPVNSEQTVLDLWHGELETFAADIFRKELPVRIMTNQGSDPPTVRGNHGSLRINVEEDVADYRGTAGVLHDVLGDYGPQDLALVVNGAQVMREPLGTLCCDLSAKDADVALVSHGDGTPSGVMLLRCGTLANISAVGYVDMKEQALPQIASRHRVSVVSRHNATGIPIRTLADYVQVLRMHHETTEGHSRGDDMFAENWNTSFEIVEQGADVASSARIHDSVVLRGSRVDAGAVLVQSVVCDGGVIRHNTMITDQLVAPQRSKTNAGNGP